MLAKTLAMLATGGLLLALVGCAASSDYATTFWNRLQQGDVSSVECMKAIEQYEKQDEPAYGRVNSSLYSYKKKRCLIVTQYNYPTESDGYAEWMLDAVTGDILVTCQFPLPSSNRPQSPCTGTLVSEDNLYTSPLGVLEELKKLDNQ